MRDLDEDALSETSDSTVFQYLTFHSNDETFAVSINDVKEIVDFRNNITEIPLMPGFIRGVMNLRGEVLLVIDLAERLSIGQTQQGKRNCIIVIEIDMNGEKKDLGVLVSSVSEVIEVNSHLVGSSPDFGTSIKAEFVSGVTELNGVFTLILNIEKVLSAEDIEALIEAAHAIEEQSE